MERIEISLYKNIFSVLFQEDSSSQEKETKGTVCLLQQVFASVVKSIASVWQWVSP
jgi:hypothetical protein